MYTGWRRNFFQSRRRRVRLGHRRRRRVRILRRRDLRANGRKSLASPVPQERERESGEREQRQRGLRDRRAEERQVEGEARSDGAGQERDLERDLDAVLVILPDECECRHDEIVEPGDRIGRARERLLELPAVERDAQRVEASYGRGIEKGDRERAEVLLRRGDG